MDSCADGIATLVAAHGSTRLRGDGGTGLRERRRSILIAALRSGNDNPQREPPTGAMGRGLSCLPRALARRRSQPGRPQAPRVRQMSFEHVREGDIVTRLLAGMIPIQLRVSKVDETPIHC